MADNRNNERVVVESDSNNVDKDRTYNRDRDDKPVRRISWGAVFAGVLTALLTIVLLNLLFYGIGISTINPASEQNPFSGLPIGTLIATVVSNLVGLFLGGYVAGKLAGTPRTFPGLMHGILTWAVLTLFTFYLSTTAIGTVLSGVTSTVSSAFSAATSGISSAASAVPGSAVPNSPQGALSAVNQVPGVNNVQTEINRLLNRAEVQNPQQAAQQLTQAAVNRIQSGESLTSQAAQQEFTNITARYSDLSQQEIQQEVQQFTNRTQQRLDEAQQQASQFAQRAANAIGTAAIIAFFVLLAGAAVAAAGSALGSPKDAEEAHRA